MTREEIYNWMDNQIKAEEIRREPADKEDPFYICVAGTETDKCVHIYHIDTLCKELDILYEEEPHSDEFDRHYFMYKDYKFFGLVEKGETNEGE